MEWFVIAAIVLGLSGSLHCVGMCGALVTGLPFSVFSGSKKTAAVTLYFAAKALGYGILGLLLGSIGSGVKFVILQRGLSIVAGLVLLAIVIFPAIKNKIPQSHALQRVLNQQYQQIFKNPSMRAFAGLGLLNAFLPCGLVYTAAAAALATGNPISGFVFMYVFGISSSPLLIALIVFEGRLQSKYRQYMNKVSYGLSLMVGLLLLLRGLNMGIPYLSPNFTTVDGQVQSSCCHKPSASCVLPK